MTPHRKSIAAVVRAPKLIFKREFGMAAAIVTLLGTLDATAQTPIPPGAADFAISAEQSDQYEIQSGRVALAQSQSPQIRAFAKQMIQDHTETSTTLKQATTASGLNPPLPSMSNDQSTMLGALQSLRGDRFDQAYIQQQILAHDQALAVDQSYADAGTDENLRKVAQSALVLIHRHQKMAEQIRRSLGGS
jgi:putative membrane protein